MQTATYRATTEAWLGQMHVRPTQGGRVGINVPLIPLFQISPTIGERENRGGGSRSVRTHNNNRSANRGDARERTQIQGHEML